MRALLLMTLALALVACGGSPSSSETPDAPPSGSPSASLGLFETAACAVVGQLGGVRSLWFDALRGEGADPESAAATLEGLAPTVAGAATTLRESLGTDLDPAVAETAATLADAIGNYAEAMRAAGEALLRKGADLEQIGGTLDVAVATVEDALLDFEAGIAACP